MELFSFANLMVKKAIPKKLIQKKNREQPQSQETIAKQTPKRIKRSFQTTNKRILSQSHGTKFNDVAGMEEENNFSNVLLIF
ncbi:hypothetical protein ACEW7V_02335 [Areca yellow leaf disease phytoplasma]|uniref:hypothetical protein n=1 Tax=Areca yellow leaf disease phytoplasma TaxID=927614 RepID=UPI0035B55E1B